MHDYVEEQTVLTDRHLLQNGNFRKLEKNVVTWTVAGVADQLSLTVDGRVEEYPKTGDCA